VTRSGAAPTIADLALPSRPGASYPNGYILLWRPSPSAGWGTPAASCARFLRSAAMGCGSGAGPAQGAGPATRPRL